MKKFLNFFVIIITSLSLMACTYKPIVDQNEKYFQVGQAQADADIDQCMKDGDAYLKQYKKTHVLKSTGRGAAIGGFIGAVFGVLGRGNLSSVATSTAVGAGVGGAAGGLGSATSGSVTPDEIKQRYVNNCLNRKGYSVLGWQ